MKPPEKEVLRKIVNDWLNKADQDAKSAHALLAQDPPLLYPSCFHSQQVAEKCLKAFLTWNQIEFPRTHSIRELLDLVGHVDEELSRKLASAARLTPYGVDIRYPGDQGEPSLEEAQEAVQLAHQVYDVVVRRIGLG